MATNQKNGGKLESIASEVSNPFQPIAHGHPDTTLQRHPQWNTYRSYSRSDLRAINPSSVEQHDHVIDLIHSDPDLAGLPYRTLDGMNFYVPADAVELLRQKGVDFSVSLVPEPSPKR